MRSPVLPLALLALGLAGRAVPVTAQQRPDSVQLQPSEAITGWQEGRIHGVAGVELFGNADEGHYVLRTRFAHGRGLGPHHHVRTTTITVLSGRFHLGIGERVDPSAARAYGPGSFLVIPAGVPHYEWGEGETIIQLSGVGPLGFVRGEAFEAGAP